MLRPRRRSDKLTAIPYASFIPRHRRQQEKHVSVEDRVDSAGLAYAATKRSLRAEREQ